LLVSIKGPRHRQLDQDGRVEVHRNGCTVLVQYIHITCCIELLGDEESIACMHASILKVPSGSYIYIYIHAACISKAYIYMYGYHKIVVGRDGLFGPRVLSSHVSKRLSWKNKKKVMERKERRENTSTREV